MNQPRYKFHYTPNLWLQINFNWFLFYKHVYLQLPNALTPFHMYYPLLMPNLTKKATVKPLQSESWKVRETELSSQFSRTSVSPRITFSTERNWNLFLLYFQLLSYRGSAYTSPHTEFKNMFILNSNGVVVFYNTSRIAMRWAHAYNLILNIFFKKICLTAFSTKVFRKEVTAFNWSYSQHHTLVDNALFKRADNFIFFKNARYGSTTRSLWLERERQGFNVSFVTDAKYHEKTVFFLKRFGVYTLGVVPLNMNPWLVSYCIPISYNNIMIELFFFKFLSFIRQQAALKSYSNSQELWKQL